MNRLKILGAFDTVPNVIEMARNKAESFPLDGGNPKSIKLHKSVQELQSTLLDVLPLLINKLVPNTFRMHFSRMDHSKSEANSPARPRFGKPFRRVED